VGYIESLPLVLKLNWPSGLKPQGIMTVIEAS